MSIFENPSKVLRIRSFFERKRTNVPNTERTVTTIGKYTPKSSGNLESGVDARAPIKRPTMVPKIPIKSMFVDSFSSFEMITSPAKLIRSEIKTIG